MTKNEAIAEALIELADEADSHRALLHEIKRLLIDQGASLSTLRTDTLDQVDRLGTRVLKLEREAANGHG